MGRQDGPDAAASPVEERLRLADSLLHAVQESIVPLQRLVSEAREAVELALRDESTARRDEELTALRLEVRQLREGMVSRAVIERAKGMLMQAHGLSDSQAFDLLNEDSQARHRKLRDVAADVVNGTALPRLAVVREEEAPQEQSGHPGSSVGGAVVRPTGS